MCVCVRVCVCVSPPTYKDHHTIHRQPYTQDFLALLQLSAAKGTWADMAKILAQMQETIYALTPEALLQMRGVLASPALGSI